MRSMFIICISVLVANMLDAQNQVGQVYHRAISKPDILFIAVDDMNDWTTLFDLSNPIKTPNLERLAKRGVFFERAYSASPACNPSRTAVMTGLRPTTTGVYDNMDWWSRIVSRDILTIPQAFAKAGYTTKGGGKIFHHGANGADRPDNPSFHEFFPLRLHSFEPKRNHNGYLPQDDKHLAHPGWDWGPHDAPRQDDEYTIEYAAQALHSQPRDRPLFLAVGIYRPHLPFWAPSSFFEQYPLGELRIPPMPAGDLNDVPPMGREMAHTEHFIWKNASVREPADPGSLFRMIQAYQAASSYADLMIGRLLDILDQSGRADNTIIVLWSDHGYHLGDKEACVKFTLWEKANRVPLIIVMPSQPNKGRRCATPVSLIDLYPTLLELAGLPRPKSLDGQSLVPLIEDPEAKWDQPALMTWGRGNHAVRSRAWRYIRYRDGTEELYDQKSDPWEWTNLVDDPKLAGVIADHRKWLPAVEVPAQRAPQ